jgi:hypothetical protein
VWRGCAESSEAVQTTSGGYRLTLADEEIDLRRFEHLVLTRTLWHPRVRDVTQDDDREHGGAAER